jgi:tetratricopeptide (TPR) repeat protein
MLRHLPFFEEISRHEESEAEWKAATAGLVVLRLVDAWMEEGVQVIRGDDWTIRSVRTAVSEVDVHGNLRAILSVILDVMENGVGVGMNLLAPRLMAYGQFLEYEARWALAEDVYATIIAHTDPVQEADAATRAHLRRGFCLRHVGDLVESMAAYRSAGRIAETADDMEGVLRARVGEAKTNLVRGNLPLAESMLDETIGQAARHNLLAVRSMALHDRAAVAGERGDYELAVKLAYEALESTQSPRDRDRILGDIANAFYRLGVRSAARDAFVILAATAQEQYPRWQATLHLMDVAAGDGDEMLFEHYRRTLDVSQLPPSLAVQYWIESGKGSDRFGRVDDARAFLDRAIAVAEEHALNQYVFDAEQVMVGLGRHVTPLQDAVPQFEDAEIEDIMHKLSAARSMVKL